ncbi:hypothetical protein CR513_36496, partial [Mucuna pruriens]
MIESFDRTQNPYTYLQAFQTQMYISGGDDRLSCKLKQDEAFGSSRSLRHQADKGETLKSYLTQFNNAMIRVNNPDKKIFLKAFQKGLRASQFRDFLTLRKP